MSHENPETAKIFLNLEDTPETQNSMSAGGADDGFGQEQPMAPQRPQQMNSTPSVASGPAIAALIVLIGGGSIFGMRVVSGQAAVSKDAFEMKVTDPVIGADFDQRFETTMAALEQSTRPVQVPLGYIPRDPFNFSDKESDPRITPVDTDPGDVMTPEERERLRREMEERLRAEKMARARIQAQQTAVDGYQLQSTLQGPNAVARISGEIMRVGGKLTYEIQHDDAPAETSFFTVESIGGRTAVLVAEDGSRYELQIGLPTRELEAAPMPEDETAADETEANSGDSVTEESDTTDADSSEDGEMSFIEKMAAAAAAAAAKADETETESSEESAEVEQTEDASSEEAAETETGDAEATETESGETETDEAEQTESPAAEESEGDATDTESEAAPETVAETEDEQSEDVTDESNEVESVEDETAQGESDATESGTTESDETSEDETGSDKESENDAEGESESGEGQGEAEPTEETTDSDDETASESGETAGEGTETPVSGEGESGEGR